MSANGKNEFIDSKVGTIKELRTKNIDIGVPSESFENTAGLVSGGEATYKADNSKALNIRTRLPNDRFQRGITMNNGYMRGKIRGISQVATTDMVPFNSSTNRLSGMSSGQNERGALPVIAGGQPDGAGGQVNISGHGNWAGTKENGRRIAGGDGLGGGARPGASNTGTYPPEQLVQPHYSPAHAGGGMFIKENGQMVDLQRTIANAQAYAGGVPTLPTPYGGDGRQIPGAQNPREGEIMPDYPHRNLFSSKRDSWKAGYKWNPLDTQNYVCSFFDFEEYLNQNTFLGANSEPINRDNIIIEDIGFIVGPYDNPIVGHDDKTCGPGHYHNFSPGSYGDQTGAGWPAQALEMANSDGNPNNPANFKRPPFHNDPLDLGDNTGDYQANTSYRLSAHNGSDIRGQPSDFNYPFDMDLAGLVGPTYRQGGSAAGPMGGKGGPISGHHTENGIPDTVIANLRKTVNDTGELVGNDQSRPLFNLYRRSISTCLQFRAHWVPKSEVRDGYFGRVFPNTEHMSDGDDGDNSKRFLTTEDLYRDVHGASFPLIATNTADVRGVGGIFPFGFNGPNQNISGLYSAKNRVPARALNSDGYLAGYTGWDIKFDHERARMAHGSEADYVHPARGVPNDGFHTADPNMSQDADEPRNSTGAICGGISRPGDNPGVLGLVLGKDCAEDDPNADQPMLPVGHTWNSPGGRPPPVGGVVQDYHVDKGWGLNYDYYNYDAVSQWCFEMVDNGDRSGVTWNQIRAAREHYQWGQKKPCPRIGLHRHGDIGTYDQAKVHHYTDRYMYNYLYREVGGERQRLFFNNNLEYNASFLGRTGETIAAESSCVAFHAPQTGFGHVGGPRPLDGTYRDMVNGEFRDGAGNLQRGHNVRLQANSRDGHTHTTRPGGVDETTIIQYPRETPPRGAHGIHSEGDNRYKLNGMANETQLTNFTGAFGYNDNNNDPTLNYDDVPGEFADRHDDNRREAGLDCIAFVFNASGMKRLAPVNLANSNNMGGVEKVKREGHRPMNPYENTTERTIVDNNIKIPYGDGWVRGYVQFTVLDNIGSDTN